MVEQFATKHIVMLVKRGVTPVTSSSEKIYHNQLGHRACSLVLLDTFYQCLSVDSLHSSEGAVVRAFTEPLPPKSGKEITLAIVKGK